MLEKAEQRSRALGITNASKFPLAECTLTSEATPAATTKTTSSSTSTSASASAPTESSASNSAAGKVVVLDKATLSASPTKPLRHYAAVNKENLEMGIEINITSAQPIGVSFFSAVFILFHMHFALRFRTVDVFALCLCLGILLQLCLSLPLFLTLSLCLHACVFFLCLYFYARCRHV